MEEGLFADAQRFFVLTQTDNMWKEHLQVCICRTVVLSLHACAAWHDGCAPSMVLHGCQCLAYEALRRR